MCSATHVNLSEPSHPCQITEASQLHFHNLWFRAGGRDLFSSNEGSYTFMLFSEILLTHLLMEMLSVTPVWSLSDLPNFTCLLILA